MIDQREYLVVNFLQLLEDLDSNGLIQEAMDHLEYHDPRLARLVRRSNQTSDIPMLLTRSNKVKIRV